MDVLHFGVCQLSEDKMERFIIVANCKQDSKVLTYSSFIGSVAIAAI